MIPAIKEIFGNAMDWPKQSHFGEKRAVGALIGSVKICSSQLVRTHQAKDRNAIVLTTDQVAEPRRNLRSINSNSLFVLVVRPDHVSVFIDRPRLRVRKR